MRDRGTRACIGRLCGEDTAAFSQMLCHSAEAVLSLTFAQIFAGQPADTSPVMFIRAHAHQLVELAHRDGSTVRATMSPSALLMTPWLWPPSTTAPRSYGLRIGSGPLFAYLSGTLHVSVPQARLAMVHRRHQGGRVQSWT
jgi:hypothetical protein